MANNPDAALQAKIARYAEILAKDPHSTVFVTLCDAYRQLGKLDEAVEIAQKGVQGLPWFSPGHVVLGQILLDRGDAGAALGCFNQALTLDGENLAAFKGLATIYCQKGQVDLARQVLERAQQIHPGNNSLSHMMSRLPDAPQPPVSQEPEVAEIEDERPADAPIATTTIADLFIKQGLLSQACQVYRDILQADPTNSQVRDKLAELEERLSSSETTEVADNHESDDSSAGADEPLATLQRWLAAIRLRRENVHQDTAGYR